MSNKFSFAIVAAALLVGSVAHAETFDFSYSFGTTDTSTFPSGSTSASGVITASPINATTYLLGNITGSWNGEAITGLAPVGADGGNDNLVFTTTPHLDLGGIAFSVAGPIAGDTGAGYVNVFYDATPGRGYSDNSFATDYSPAFTLTAVPEPAAWSLMLVGAAVIGGALRRRRVALA